MKTSRLLSLLPCVAASLICFSQPAHAGHWVVTYQCSGYDMGADDRGNPVFVAVDPAKVPAWNQAGSVTDTNNTHGHIWPDAYVGWSEANYVITPTLTWTPDNLSDTSSPPSTVPYLESSVAYGTVEDPEYGQTWAADDGTQDPAQVEGDELISSGRHLLSYDNSANNATITLPSRTLNAAGGQGVDYLYEYSSYLSYSVVIDPYKVTLSRDGARGETQDADGTTHGDTIYSYGDYINTEDFGQQERTDYLNMQTFQPNFLGNWTFPQGSSPYWAWNPSESDDTSTMGKVSMHYRNYYTLEGEPNGSDSAETRTVSYSVTDPLGAEETANYILTVHDPYESYINNHRLKLENYQRQPNSPSWTSTPTATTGDVYISQENSWGGSISLDNFGELICENSGINISANYSFSVTAGAYAHAGPLTPGYTTWAETYDEYDEYYGTLKVWDAGGYVGTTPYDEQIPNGQIGIIAAPPVWSGPGDDPKDPFPSS
jgi:hypothetical protein